MYFGIWTPGCYSVGDLLANTVTIIDRFHCITNSFVVVVVVVVVVIVYRLRQTCTGLLWRFPSKVGT